MRSRSLDDLLTSAGLPVLGDAAVWVSGMTEDSRKVGPGGLFVALRGVAVDARRFIPKAVAQGAAAVVVDDPAGVDTGDTPLIVVDDGRRALARLAQAWFDHPARSVQVAGVTGTNGKTSVTYFLESIFAEAGWRPGVMGTIEYRWPGGGVKGKTTTPSPLEVAELMARVRDGGGRAVAMEVSSHGVDQARVDGFAFAAAVITNLTQDHLDYHGTIEAYGEAKKKFFFGRHAGEEPGVAIFNYDDPFSRSLSDAYTGRQLTYGGGAGADVRMEVAQDDCDGTTLIAHTPTGRWDFRIALPGWFNALNAGAALATGLGMGMDGHQVVAGLEALACVPGRFERILEGQPFEVVVDYAHTPDALAVTLSEARRLCRGRLVVVFGCGGDRDAGKRPMMGEVVGRLSDWVIVTNDNPRGESPEAIATGIVEGLESAGKCPDRDFEVILDRREAMDRALGWAVAGDMVVFAGRGHETEQLLASGPRAFDDREVARELLRARGFSQ